MIQKSVRAQSCAAASLFILAASPALAQSPLVHLPLDGSAANQGAAGTAELIVPDGADQPQFVPGHIGQALSLGKGGAVAIAYEFNQTDQPRATVTMWIKLEQDTPYERELLSLGPGNGLLFRVTGKRSINVRSYREATHDKAFPLGEWVFVAGVVDNEAGTIRIQQNDDVFEATGLDIRAPNSLTVTAPGEDERKHYIFVGADDFNSAGKEIKPVTLDDVRLYAGALSPSQIDAIRNAGPSQPADAPEDEQTAIGETEKNDSSVYAELPQDVTRTVPETATPDKLPDANEPGPSATTRPAGPPIASMPDDGPKITAGLPPAEEADDAPSYETIGTADRDLSGIDTSTVDKTIDLSKEAANEQEESEPPAKTAQNAGPETSSAGGKIYAKGEPQYSALTGAKGDCIDRVDLSEQFIRRIGWIEDADKPCAVQLEGVGADYFDSPERNVIVWEKGCYGYAHYNFNVELDDATAIGRIQVCESSTPGSKRVKGVKIYGDVINPDGSTTYHPAASTRELTNCGTWRQDVLCPTGSLSTGLVIHYNANNDRPAITGFQLICRAVGLR